MFLILRGYALCGFMFNVRLVLCGYLDCLFYRFVGWCVCVTLGFYDCVYTAHADLLSCCAYGLLAC